MLKALNSDFRRLFNSKAVLLFMIILPAVFSLTYLFVDLIVGTILGKPNMEFGDMGLTTYAQSSALCLSLLASAFTTMDFVDGTIRNKLCVGIKRIHVFWSACVVSAFQAVVMHLIASAVAILVGITMYEKFALTNFEILKLLSVYGIAEVAVAVLFTAIVFVFSNSKILYGICPGIVVLTRVLIIIVIDKLYPDSGILSISGARLKIYTFLDRYVPFFQLESFLRWDMKSYILGGLVTIIIAVLVGTVVIGKKEIK